ncbi:Syndecan, conserved site,Syndecan/Neurexin domain [Cinara cedri]|uniref:Syndecan n=1 Tax=Cinara cedri TaxID=506608 RepID=A0A5E4NBZ5_9HEMI|nr:Syndecan, conserved site,Syndecan/Neurexin domain [Cinara cedri]
MIITTMEPKFLCSVVCLVFVFCTNNVLAEPNKNVSLANPTTSQSSKPSLKDELFIDDETDSDDGGTDKSEPDDMMLGEEGSGMGASSKGTGAEDMESSGSGYGPDDEDALVKSNNEKLDTDDEEDEDDIEEEEEEEEEEEDGEDGEEFEKAHKGSPVASTSTSTTSTTTTTTESYEEEPVIPDLPKTNIIEDNINPPTIAPDVPQTITSTVPSPPSNTIDEHSGNGVYISPNSHPERTSSFFAQPGILAAVIGGAVVGLLCAILVVMFIVYRMRKKDEGSYPLEETKRSPATNPYLKSTHREFYA